MRRIPGIRVITGRYAPPRWLTGGSLALALASAALGCGHDPAPPRKPPEPPACWTLAHVPGPEDLVVDAVNRRLLVSSQDRREKPRPKGAIWSVPLDGQAEPCELELAGREDGCSFHPHGIDLVQSRDGRWLLYVLNHEEAADASPSRGCLPGPGLPGPDRGPFTSVEVFAVERTELRFLQRLADPRVLTHGNDLVALPGGDVWVTDPPSRPMPLWLDAGGWRPRSKLDHFTCAPSPDGRCTGAWTTAELEGKGAPSPIPQANGIAWRPCAEASAGHDCAGELYVAAGAGGAIHHFLIGRDGALKAQEVIYMPARTNPDNLTWGDDSRDRLLVATHPDLRRFLQHTLAPEVPSPSEVVEVVLRDGGGKAEPVFYDSGGLISASSVAAPLAGDLVLGQVFEPAVLRCRVPGLALGGPRP